MLNNILKMNSFLLLVLFSFAAPAQSIETCLGELFSYRGEPLEVVPPTVKIIEQGVLQLKAGETLPLTAEIVAQGQANLIWCTPTGELIKNNDDLTTVTYQAPAIITEDQVVSIGIQADDNGYVGGDTILAYLQKSNSSQTFIIIGTIQKNLLVYTPTGELRTVIPTGRNLQKIAAVDADNDQADEIAVEGLTGVYELTGQLVTNVTAQDAFAVKADVDGDGDLETIIGSLSTNEVTVDGTSFPVFDTSSNTRRGIRDGKKDDKGKKDDDGKEDKGSKKQKTIVCHKGKILEVAESALGGHLDHGDTRGECPPKVKKEDGKEDKEKHDDDDKGETIVTDNDDSSHNDDKGNTAKGVNVAAGDLDNDGQAEIVAAMAHDGSLVEIYSGDGEFLNDFTAFDSQQGVVVAVANSKIIVGEIGGTQVKFFDMNGLEVSGFNVSSGNIISLAVAMSSDINDNGEITSIADSELPSAEVKKPPYFEENSGYTKNEIYTDATIRDIDHVSHIKLGGHGFNHGFVSNSEILEGAIITGGYFSGNIKNHGILKDIYFIGRWLEGGQLSGNITIKHNRHKGFGYLKQIYLSANAKLMGGILQGFVIGDQTAPAHIDEAEIDAGTRVENAVIGPNTIVSSDAILGANVRFEKNENIPENIDLTSALPAIENSETGLPTAIDLSQDVIADAEQSLLQQVNDIPDLQVQQDKTGQLFLTIGRQRSVFLLPTEVKQGKKQEKARHILTADGTIILVTKNGRMIKSQPIVHNPTLFVNTLKELQIENVALNTSGVYTAKLKDGKLAAVRFNPFIEMVADDVPLGVAETKEMGMMSFTSVAQKGKKQQQYFYPTTAEPEILKLSKYQALFLEKGKVGLSIDGARKIGHFDYVVTQAETETKGELTISLVKKSSQQSEYEVTYANGSKQLLFVPID